MEDKSNRTDILYSIIKRFIQPEFQFLDVGCGFSPLFLGTELPSRIHDDFPNARYCGIDTIKKVIEWCRKSHPRYEWVCIPAEKFKIEKRYDFVIHTGIDKSWSDAWKINIALIDSETPPNLVLLEAGRALNNQKNKQEEIYERVVEIYLNARYEKISTGVFVWDLEGVKSPLRIFSLLRVQGD